MQGFFFYLDRHLLDPFYNTSMLSGSITAEGLENVQPFFTPISDLFCLTSCWSRPREKPCLVFSAGFRLLINTAHVKCVPLARRHAKISSERPERARRGYICGA